MVQGLEYCSYVSLGFNESVCDAGCSPTSSQEQGLHCEYEFHDESDQQNNPDGIQRLKGHGGCGEHAHTSLCWHPPIVTVMALPFMVTHQAKTIYINTKADAVTCTGHQELCNAACKEWRQD